MRIHKLGVGHSSWLPLPFLSVLRMGSGCTGPHGVGIGTFCTRFFLCATSDKRLLNVVKMSIQNMYAVPAFWTMPGIGKRCLVGVFSSSWFYPVLRMKQLAGIIFYPPALWNDLEWSSTTGIWIPTQPDSVWLKLEKKTRGSVEVGRVVDCQARSLKKLCVDWLNMYWTKKGWNITNVSANVGC